MSDTFDFVAFLSAVSGDGDWPDEFLAWYQPGAWLSDERACAAFIAEKFVQLQADRDSWYQQHSDRVDDAVRFAAERDAALAEIERLNDLLARQKISFEREIEIEIDAVHAQVAQEREACAMVCDQQAVKGWPRAHAVDCAAAIRSRGAK